MKEIVTNKLMIGVMVFMIGFSYIASSNFQTARMDENKTDVSYEEAK